MCMAGSPPPHRCGQGWDVQYVLHHIVYAVAVQPPTGFIYLDFVFMIKTSILKVTWGGGVGGSTIMTYSLTSSY